MHEDQAVNVLTRSYCVPYDRARGYVTEARETGTATVREAGNRVIMLVDGGMFVMSAEDGDISGLLEMMKHL